MEEIKESCAIYGTFTVHRSGSRRHFPSNDTKSAMVSKYSRRKETVDD